MKLVDVWVHSSKESMWDLGEEIGLSEEAIGEFKYTAYEVKLVYEVDEKTGKSKLVGACEGNDVLIPGTTRTEG